MVSGLFALRTLVAAALPAVAVAVAWGRLESSGSRELIAVAFLAILPALTRSGTLRALLAAVSVAAAVWIAFGAQMWELAPYRDERVISPLAEAFGRGVGDFYDVIVPFDPSRRPEMHGVLALAVFGFVLAVALLVAARQPLTAAAVTIAGAGWPATLVDSGAVALGTLALAGALSIALVLRARSSRTLVGGVVVGALVVGGAASVSSATSFTRSAVVDWRAWNVGGIESPRAAGVRFIWDAQYDGIAFPPTPTEVLRISGPDQPQYWRSSTLDVFPADRWQEELGLVLTSGSGGQLVSDGLVPQAARDEANWIEQEIEVRALVDNRLVAAGIPVFVDARLGTLYSYEGGLVHTQRALSAGSKYRMWSYLPNPAPRALARAPARYPAATAEYKTLWGRSFPAFGAPGRARAVNAILADTTDQDVRPYRPLWRDARRITAGARSPYAAVLALESWFRQSGGFRYEEQPSSGSEPPLVHFVTSSREGYCQHFAGAMTLMTRLLGIPSRVAVGFTSGSYRNKVWSVTDYNAHAWVEVWFPGHGWISFDPTPGRGTFSSRYSLATSSSATGNALRRGDFRALDEVGPEDSSQRGSRTGVTSSSEPPSILALGVLLGVLAAGGLGIVKWTVRRSRYLTRDPRRIATASRRELEGFLRDQGVPVRATATLDDLRRAVDAELGLDAQAFVDAVARGRFGLEEEAATAARRARNELRRLLRKTRADLSLAARLRGFVSFRSLREWQG